MTKGKHRSNEGRTITASAVVYARRSITRWTLSLPSLKSTFSQPFKQKMYWWGSERIGSIIIFHLSKRCKPSSLYCVMLYFWWSCRENLKLITLGTEQGFTFSWHPVSWHGSKLYKYCNLRQGPDIDLTKSRCVGLTWILDVPSKFWIFGYFGKDNRRFYARKALWSRGALWGHVCASRTCCIRVLIRFTSSNPRSCTCWGVMSHEMWNLRTRARQPNPQPLYSLVCLFVCWFCLPDPALPQVITFVASSVSSFLLSGSLHSLVCLFVCWLVYQMSVQMRYWTPWKKQVRSWRFER